MREAVDLARSGMQEKGGGPFGALVVCDGRIVGRGNNRVTEQLDPTAHAEIVAIREACRALGRFDLRGCVLYTSCEPCPMCLAAIYWARLDHSFLCGVHDMTRPRQDSTTSLFMSSFRWRSRRVRFRWNQLLREQALELFREWATKPDKIHYQPFPPRLAALSF